jgi:hypothetical protein
LNRRFNGFGSSKICPNLLLPAKCQRLGWDIGRDTVAKIEAGIRWVGDFELVYLPSWGCVSAIDSQRRTIWIVDAHRDDGKRFIVRADEKLTAFLELESAICACGELV